MSTPNAQISTSLPFFNKRTEEPWRNPEYRAGTRNVHGEPGVSYSAR